MNQDDKSSCDSWDSIEDRDADPRAAAAKCLFLGSEHFNPIISLGCRDTVLPVPDAPRYRSITEFEECVSNLEETGEAPPKFAVSKKSRKVLSRLVTRQSQSSSQSHNSAQNCDPLDLSSPLKANSDLSRTDGGGVTTEITLTEEQRYPIPGRRFLPHQLPVARVEKKKSNVLTLMDECEGPLVALNDARLKFRRIRVWRRDRLGIRGYCSGFVIGFDKHWNLILKDVDEIYQRRRIRPENNENPVSMSSSGKIEEKLAFNSGDLLSEYKETIKASRQTGTSEPISASKIVRKGTPTGYLIEGPQDAVEVCRIGMRSLMLRGIEQEKLKSRGKHSSASLPPSTNSVTTPPATTKSTLRKKQLVILRDSQVDFLGNKIVARTQLYEIVERHLAQIVVMGRSIAFVETNL